MRAVLLQLAVGLPTGVGGQGSDASSAPPTPSCTPTYRFSGLGLCFEVCVFRGGGQKLFSYSPLLSMCCILSAGVTGLHLAVAGLAAEGGGPSAQVSQTANGVPIILVYLKIVTFCRHVFKKYLLFKVCVMEPHFPAYTVNLEILAMLLVNFLANLPVTKLSLLFI